MISILIPIYNGIEFIDESVTSVLKQTYEKWELLIVINGHTENSDVYKIAKKYEEKSNKIKVFDFYNIKGKSNALNEIIKYCNFNYVAILDVDDIWHEKKLEIQSRYFEKNYDVIGSRCVWFGDRPGIVPIIPLEDISNYDLWLKLRKQGKTFYNCKEVLVKHRIHNTSAFNANGNHNKVGDLLKSYGY